MKKIFLIAIFLFSTAVYSDSPATRETVEQLMELMNSESMVEQIYNETEKMAEGLSSQMGLKESERSMFEKFMKKVSSEMKSEISWKKMKDPLIDVYMRHYTQNELEDIISFYKTETGQALLKKAPLVMRDSIQVSQNMLKDFLPRIMDLAKELEEELKTARKAQE